MKCVTNSDNPYVYGQAIGYGFLYKSVLILVTSDHGHRYLNSLIGWEMSAGPTSFYIRSPYVTVSTWKNEWNSKVDSYMSRNG